MKSYTNYSYRPDSLRVLARRGLMSETATVRCLLSAKWLFKRGRAVHL